MISVTYFRDLTEYTYSSHFQALETLNIGWLERSHEFKKKPPTEEFLNFLWDFCSISVARSRGFHFCDICVQSDLVIVERSGKSLILGGAEIRAFSKSGRIYAAPNLIYHYVYTHHYLPPAEFIEAIVDGPKPPCKEYFDRLVILNLEWGATTPFTSDSIIFPAPPA